MIALYLVYIFEEKLYIQSYFIVFRKKLLTSKHFRQWWENLVPAKGYKEEVGYHETKFSKYFEDAGYISSCLMNVEKYFALLPNDNSSFIYANSTYKKKTFY